jgi:hypothetical protein
MIEGRQDMNRKKLYIFLGAEAILCLAAATFNSLHSGIGYEEIAAFPFAQIGTLLRWMSLSGIAGNIAAVILYLAIGAAPFLYSVRLSMENKAETEDLLLLVISLLLFVMMYFMVNPGCISISQNLGGPTSWGKAIWGGAFYSVLIGYLFLKMLRKITQSGTGKILETLKALFMIAAALLVCAVFYIGVSSVFSDIAAVKTANTDPFVSLSLTNCFIVIRFALQNAAAVLDIVILLMAARLAGALKTERYGEEVVGAADALASFCKKAVIAMILCSMTSNILQLLFSGSLHKADFVTQIPLDSVILVLVMFLLARYFAESKEIQEDNELFI